MKNAIRGLNRIWVVLACAYLIFALIYWPKKIVEGHKRAASGARRTVEERAQAIQEANELAQQHVDLARKDLVSERLEQIRAEKDLASSTTKLAELRKQIDLLAEREQIERQETAVHKETYDKKVAIEVAAINSHSPDAETQKVLEQLEKVENAQIEELRKQLPPEPPVEMKDRRQIQFLIKLSEQNAGAQAMEAEEAKGKVKAAEEEVLDAEKALETKSWFPDLSSYDARLVAYDSATKWDLEDLARIAFATLIPIGLSWIAFRVLLMVFVWVANGFKG